MSDTFIDGKIMPAIIPSWDGYRAMTGTLSAGNRLFARYEQMDMGAPDHTQSVRAWLLDESHEVIKDTAKEAGEFLWLLEIYGKGGPSRSG
jgi:hypothetical protein